MSNKMNRHTSLPSRGTLKPAADAASSKRPASLASQANQRTSVSAAAAASGSSSSRRASALESPGLRRQSVLSSGGQGTTERCSHRRSQVVGSSSNRQDEESSVNKVDKGKYRDMGTQTSMLPEKKVVQPKLKDSSTQTSILKGKKVAKPTQKDSSTQASTSRRRSVVFTTPQTTQSQPQPQPQPRPNQEGNSDADYCPICAAVDFSECNEVDGVCNCDYCLSKIPCYCHLCLAQGPRPWLRMDHDNAYKRLAKISNDHYNEVMGLKKPQPPPRK